jgi:FkbM family methyltransferase
MNTLAITTLPARIKRWVSAPPEPRPRDPQATLDESHRFFAELSAKAGVASVSFRSGEALVVMTDGRRFVLDPSIKAARMYSVPFTGTFEAKETEFLRGLVKPGDVCIDVGASFGWFATLFAKLAGEDGQVHAFEPIPDTVAALRRNLEVSGCGNVEVNDLALDDAQGARPIFVPDAGVSGALRLPRQERSFETFEIRTTRLDDYARERGLKRLDVLKADIEGAELSMLRGAAVTLARFRPVLLLEVQAHSTRLFGHEPSDLFAFLETFGYEPHYVDGNGDLCHVRDPHGELPDYNFVFLPLHKRRQG